MGAGGKVDQIPGKDLNQWDSAAGRPRVTWRGETGAQSWTTQMSGQLRAMWQSWGCSGSRPRVETQTETESKGPSKERSTGEVARWRRQLWAFLPFEMLALSSASSSWCLFPVLSGLCGFWYKCQQAGGSFSSVRWVCNSAGVQPR